jgi:hypothetical protein
MANQRFGRKKAGYPGKNFSRSADRTHFMNVKPRPQRGGIRL